MAGSWWQQLEDFENFNGAILMTTNCIVPLRKENTYLKPLLHHWHGELEYAGARHILNANQVDKKTSPSSSP
jgi:hydroxylamine reductase